MHVYMNTSTSYVVTMRSLSIPPFRLCGGNLEMLQGRALELDNICQEISIKDLCKRLWASPLSEEKVFELRMREKELTVSTATSQLTTGCLSALHETSLGTSRDSAQSSFRGAVLSVSPKYCCLGVLARETVLLHHHFNTPHLEALRYFHPN